MKKYLLACVLLSVFGSSQAESILDPVKQPPAAGTGSTVQTGAPVASNPGTVAGQMGFNTSQQQSASSQAESQINNSSIGNTYTTAYGSRIPVASSVAPPLTSSGDTCMGSYSGGISTVSIGISLGGTWTDDNCVMLKNARELYNYGYRDSALARLCMDELNSQALEVTGINCPDYRRLRELKKEGKPYILQKRAEAAPPVQPVQPVAAPVYPFAESGSKKIRE